MRVPSAPLPRSRITAFIDDKRFIEYQLIESFDKVYIESKYRKDLTKRLYYRKNDDDDSSTEIEYDYRLIVITGHKDSYFLFYYWLNS